MTETALAAIASMADEVEGTTPSMLEVTVQNPAFVPNDRNDDSLDSTVAYGIALSTYAVEIAADAFADAYKTAQGMKDIFYGKPVLDWDMIRKVDTLSEYARKRADIPTSRVSLIQDGSSPRDLVRIDMLADLAYSTMNLESERLFGTFDMNAGSGRMRSFVAFLADKKFNHAQSVVDDCKFHPAFKEYLKQEIHKYYHG